MTTTDHIEIDRPKRGSWITLVVAVVTLLIVIAYSLLSLYWQQHYEIVIYPLFTISGSSLSCFLSCCVLPFAASLAWILNGWSSADKVGRSTIVIFLVCAGWMFYFGYQSFGSGFFEHQNSIRLNTHIYHMAAMPYWDDTGYKSILLFKCGEQEWICTLIHKTPWHFDGVQMQLGTDGEHIELVTDNGEVLYTYPP